MNDRLYRSRSDRVIAGVCGGLAARLDLDPSIVRIGWVLLTFLTGGVFFVIYVIMLVVVPEEPVGGIPPSAPGPGPDAYPGWVSPTTAGPSIDTAATAGATDAGSAGETGGAFWTPPGAAASEGPTEAGTASASGWTGPGATPTADGGAPAAGGEAPAAGGGAPAAGTPPARGEAPWVPPAQGSAGWAEERRARRGARDHTSALVFGLLLILLGAYFLVRESLPTVDIDRAWPVAVIVVGVVFLALSVRRSSGPA